MSFWSRLFPGEQRCFGYILSPRDSRDLGKEVLGLREGIGEPPSVSIRHPAVTVRSQAPNNSCLGFAVAQGIELAYAHRGRLTGDLSARAPYFWGRAAQGRLPLDDGTEPRPVLNAVMRFGIPTEATCVTSGFTINVAPNWKAHQDARDIGRLKNYAWIDPNDLSTIRQCIRDSVPVVGGWPCDDAFLHYSGASVLEPPTGTIIGYHAMLITGYYNDGTFDIFNQSWPNWGEDGSYARVSQEFIQCSVEYWGLAVSPPSLAA